MYMFPWSNQPISTFQLIEVAPQPFLYTRDFLFQLPMRRYSSLIAPGADNICSCGPGCQAIPKPHHLTIVLHTVLEGSLTRVPFYCSKMESSSSSWFRDEYALRCRDSVFGAADSSDKVAGLTFRQLGMVNRHRHLP